MKYCLFVLLLLTHTLFAQNKGVDMPSPILMKYKWDVKRVENFAPVNPNEKVYIFHAPAQRDNLVVRTKANSELTKNWKEQFNGVEITIYDEVEKDGTPYIFNRKRSDLSKGILVFDLDIGNDAPSPWDEIMTLTKAK